MASSSSSSIVTIETPVKEHSHDHSPLPNGRPTGPIEKAPHIRDILKGPLHPFEGIYKLFQKMDLPTLNNASIFLYPLENMFAGMKEREEAKKNAVCFPYPLLCHEHPVMSVKLCSPVVCDVIGYGSEDEKEIYIPVSGSHCTKESLQSLLEFIQHYMEYPNEDVLVDENQVKENEKNFPDEDKYLFDHEFANQKIMKKYKKELANEYNTSFFLKMCTGSTDIQEQYDNVDILPLAQFVKTAHYLDIEYVRNAAFSYIGRVFSGDLFDRVYSFEEQLAIVS